MLDQLQRIMTYKSLHALCTVTKQKDEDGRPKMRVVYFVSCLVYGRAPLWGVWNASGKFLHFAGGKEAISDQHPNLTWRRVMARWRLADDGDSQAVERRKLLSDELGAELPEYADHEEKPAIKQNGRGVAALQLH